MCIGCIFAVLALDRGYQEGRAYGWAHTPGGKIHEKPWTQSDILAPDTTALQVDPGTGYGDAVSDCRMVLVAYYSGRFNCTPEPFRGFQMVYDVT